ncbi:TNF receptor-associated factor 6 [Nematostella vectensis]|uniref:TNF receptor-associated factor 6 n=1 Tax=Nematostella vectensis TaxID=45351 RepID=UPI0020774EB0|nr:TNF receptor-associated factor 6 [Nematostella vectensis]
MNHSFSGPKTRNASEYDEIRGTQVPASLPFINQYGGPQRLEEGYDELFDPPLESKYECPICLLGLRDPVQTPCGHRFCFNCIRRSIRDAGPKCPVDNTPLSERELYRDNFAKREMMSFIVWCRLKKERGCTWKGALKELEEHLKGCPCMDTNCPNECGAVMQRKEVDKHCAEACPNRSVPCDHCKMKVTISKIEKHLKECPKMVIQCKSCKQNVTREKMTDHLQSSCPKMKSTCPFAFLGCDFEGFNPAVIKHVTENREKHFFELGRYHQRLNTEGKGGAVGGKDKSRQSSKEQASHGPQEHTPHEAELRREALFQSANMQREVDMLGSRGDEYRQFLAYLERKVEDVKTSSDRRIAELTHKLMRLETREIELEGRVCNGTFIWKLDNFRQCREGSIAGLTAAIHSPPFYTSMYGYKMCLRMNLNGVDGGLGEHVSLFIHMMQGDWDGILEWPFIGRITLSILDQSDQIDSRRPISETLVAKPNLLAFQRPTSPRNHKGYGYVEFCPIDQLTEGQYIKNNSILVRIQISR